MSLHRRAARKDTNHTEVVEAFLAAGCTVQVVNQAGAPDLVVGYRGRDFWVEIKSQDDKLNPLQRSWHSHWRGGKPFVAVHPEEVPAILREVMREWEDL